MNAAGPASPRGPIALRASGLVRSFGALTVLEGLDLEVGAGRTLALVGPSGCGKSTFLELAAGLLEPSAGTIEVEGDRVPAGRLAHCAYMPQGDSLLPWYSALDNAAIPLRNRGASRAEARRAAAERFTRFGLAGFEDARPRELSGGMRQRVAFLRTLVSEKPVLLLDEPFAALDAITRAELQEWLAGALSYRSRTTVLVTHDVEEALLVADEVVVLTARPGRVAASFEAPEAGGRDRDEVVTDPGFVRVRERVLKALAEAGGRAGAAAGSPA